MIRVSSSRMVAFEILFLALVPIWFSGVEPFVKFKMKLRQGILLRNCVELWPVVQEVM